MVDFKLKNGPGNPLPYSTTSGFTFPCQYCTGAVENDLINLGNNEIVVDTISGFPAPINSQPIDSLNNWGVHPLLHIHTRFVSTYTSTSSYSYTNTIINIGYADHGNFGGVNEFVGLKLKTGGSTYYGWLRLDVFNDSLVLKDYAINTIPDSAIIAGDMGTICNWPPLFTYPNGDVISCDPYDTVTMNLYNWVGYNMQWMLNGQPINGAVNNYCTYTGFGNFSVLVSNSNCFQIVNCANHIQSSNPIPILIFDADYYYIYTEVDYNSYQWYLNGVLIPGANQEHFYPVQAGYYSVQVTNNYECIGSSTIDCYFPGNSIHDIESAQLQFSVDDKKLQFHLADNSLMGNQIDILNQIGQLVTTVTVTNQTPEADLSALPAGIYFYHIRSKQKTYSGKFFIE